MKNLENKIFKNFPLICIALLPILLITGPFLPDLCVVLVCIFFFANIIREKNYSLLKSKFFVIFLIFFIYLVLNSLIKYFDFDNLRSSLSYLRFGVFTVAVIYFIEKNNKILKWIFYSFLISFLILIIDGYNQYFYKVNLFSTPVDILSGRIRFLLNDDYILGSYLSRLYPIFLGLTFIYLKMKKIIFFVSFLFVLIETLIFLSGERVAFFFNTMSAIFIIVMIQRFKYIRFVTLVISFGIIF